MMQTNFSPRNISANKVERVVPNALKDFRGGPSVLRASRSTSAFGLAHPVISVFGDEGVIGQFGVGGANAGEFLRLAGG